MEELTLAMRLRALELQNRGKDKHEGSAPSHTLAKLKQDTLSEFCEKYPLIRKITLGESSFEQLIKPIENRYASFLGKYFPGRIDKVLDQEIAQISISLNAIGAAENIDVQQLSTRGHKEEQQQQVRKGIGWGLVWGSLAGTSAYLAAGAAVDIAKMIGAASSFGAVFLAHYSIVGLQENISSQVQQLRITAQKTDEYLRPVLSSK